MAITFRHDAAGVVPPSNASTRKYGQSLVLQQQQQKYAAQQAGYDRMFDAYKMENQQQFQDKRDTKQVINQQLRDWQQQDFQKQQMEAARQQQFMDDARKLSSGMIMDDIKNGHYDPATAGKLRKNLVDEADALADKTLDATQRKKVLDTIRADRLLHTSNRMEKPPQPTATDRFNQRKHFDEESGQWFIENSKGDFVPVVDPRQQQQQEKLQQQQLQQQEQEAEKMRPKSMEEYYSDNEDKFQKDLDSTMSSMQNDYDLDPTKPAPTRESALKKMQDDYDFRQQALGKPQYGEPTLAKPYGQALEEARKLPGNEYHQLADMNEKLLELENRFKSLPKDSAERKKALNEYHQERDRLINGGAQPTPEMKSILEQPGQQLTAQAAPTPAVPTAPMPVAPTAQAPTQSDWDTLAAGQGLVDMGPAGQPTPAQPATPPKAPAIPSPSNAGQNAAKPVAPPDFGALASSAGSADKPFVNNMQQLYQGQTPEVQSAISVLLDPAAQDEDAARAMSYLQSKGIDLEALAKPMTRPASPRGSKPPRLPSPNSSGSPRAKR